MRFISRRRILAVLSLAALLFIALAGGLVVYINSPAFEEDARRYIVREIENRTGGEAALERFDLNLWDQRIRLAGLTLRGTEPPGDAALAHVERIDVGVNLRSLLQRKIDLFELIITRPAFHVIVDENGRTNFPTPPDRGPRGPFNLEISIENFRIAEGSALLNERRIHIDFALKYPSAALRYDNTRKALGIDIAYEGALDRSPGGKPSIPYKLAGNMDYTRDTLLAHRMTITSGATEVKLQGKITDLLNRNIAGRFEYTGNIDVPFLNYFFTRETFAGKADAAGFFEFARGYYFTQGHAVSDAVDFEGWHATNVLGDYAYHYPEKRLSFRKMKSNITGGSVTGDIVVENIPGKSRVNLGLTYGGIDTAALARAYPWDPKYRIYSRAAGTLNGWFEGKLDWFAFNGRLNLKPYTPPAGEGIVALPLEGSTEYDVRPGEARVANADMRFYSTAVQANGLIHTANSNLALKMNSSDLRDLAFLYHDANGTGSFDGTLTKAIAKPDLTGQFVLDNHKYRDWTIQRAAGGVHLDTETEAVDLRNVRVTQGDSEVLISGNADLDGSPVDLQVQSSRVLGKDLRMFIDRNIDGVFAGSVHVTSLEPIKLEGDVRAEGLIVNDRLVGDGRGHVRYFEPLIEVDQLAVRQGNATLTGNVAFNQSNDAVKFAVRANGVDLGLFHEFGLPPSIQGTIQQATLRGDGARSRPNISGNAAVRNLSVYGETFPEAQLELVSTGTKLNVTMDVARNLDLSAEIDTASNGYPFTSRAVFTNYPLEHIARLPEGKIIVTGRADLAGLLTDSSRLRGTGTIQSGEAQIQDQTLRTTKPFTFDFNTDRLTVSGVTLVGQATEVNLAGTIGLRERATLGLDVSGKLDLALLTAAYPEWFSSGTMNVEGRIGGNVQSPDLRGVAHLTNASVGRRGFFTSLSTVNGDLFFDENRITVNNVTGRVGGGTVRAQGTAVLQRTHVEAMNIRVEADDVRVRYPEGLRTIVDGSLVLRGSSGAPVLDGNLEIQSLTYRSSFEEFLALFSSAGLEGPPSPLGLLGLSLHVEGSRNITIQNQLAEVEARIDVDIKGTVDDPRLTGHVEASGGTLYFQGNRYRITRGNIDFVDPVRIEPIVDVQAETEVRDYRVILAITGRGDRLRLGLSSDPPLPELEIVSLIAGGRTRDEYGRAGAGVPTGEELFATGATSILSDLLQQRVGSRLQLFGLDRLRLDPILGTAGQDATARLTLSKQVTKDLSITYSQDLSSNREPVVLIEYFLSRTTSIVVSQDETGAKGLDIRFRKRFK